MNFAPLKYPNISQSFFDAKNPSLSIDSRGFPHLVWIENNQHIHRIHYKYWDGLQWAVIEESDLDFSDVDIIASENSLILDEDDPIVVFSKNNESNSQINVFNVYDGEWVKKRTNVNYKIKWIGASIYDQVLEDFSSSSSLISSSSSSSSSNLDSSSSSSVDSSSSSSESTSSSSSSSEGESSSSSSSEVLSSSSSYGVTSSSSTSSYLEGYIYISTIDDQGILRVYLSDNGTLSLLTTNNMSVNSFDLIKHGVSGNNLYYAYETNGQIWYGFVGIDSYSLKNEWTEISGVSNLLSWNVHPFYVESDGGLYLSWIEKSNPAYMKLQQVDSNGVQSNYGFFEDKLVITDTTSITCDDFLINLSKNIGICIKSDIFSGQYLNLMVLGTRNNQYSTMGGVLNETFFNIEGAPNDLAPSQFTYKLLNDIGHIVFVNQNDIYYYKEVDDIDLTFDIPDLILLNSQRLKYGVLLDGVSIAYMQEVECMWDNRAGDILRESMKKVVVTANETDDPLCDTSSSSSSSDSSASSLSTQSSNSSDSSDSSISILSSDSSISDLSSISDVDSES